jgi:protein-S-isoprenylcysteine O-methyltransferase Ste14
VVAIKFLALLIQVVFVVYACLCASITTTLIMTAGLDHLDLSDTLVLTNRVSLVTILIFIIALACTHWYHGCMLVVVLFRQPKDTVLCY